jgi:hypothetical protein
MDTNQSDFTNRPLCERVGFVDERLTLERMNCYLARARYMHSEFTVQLLTAFWLKLKFGLMRTVRFVRRTADKMRGSGGLCDNDAFARQKPGVICKKEIMLRS